MDSAAKLSSSAFIFVSLPRFLCGARARTKTASAAGATTTTMAAKAMKLTPRRVLIGGARRSRRGGLTKRARTAGQATGNATRCRCRPRWRLPTRSTRRPCSLTTRRLSSRPRRCTCSPSKTGSSAPTLKSPCKTCTLPSVPGGGATDGGDSPARERRWKEAKAGAWTGELTTDMVKDAGVHWTILGHSERRSVVSAESSELVGHKVRGPRACVVTLTRTCTL